MIICNTCHLPFAHPDTTRACCTCVDKCKGKQIDSYCVKYGSMGQYEETEFTCMAIPLNTPVHVILLEIYRMLNNRIKVIDTYTLDFTFQCNTLKADVRIDYSGTLPVSVGPNGIKLDCCVFDCGSIVYSFDFEILEIERLLDFYTRLEDWYFTKSDILTNITFHDLSVMVGDTLSWLTYTSFLLGGTATIYNLGDTFSMPIYTCVGSLVGLVKPLLIEAYTKKGCYFSKICDQFIERVDYGERYAYPYRANFQINDMPIMPDPTVSPAVDKGVVYWNDVIFLTQSGSLGGVVRKINLNTKETTTLAGDFTLAPGANTLNNEPGNTVTYNYSSAIVADKSTIVNSEPVLYFATFGEGGVNGGVISRLVRDNPGHCDERENWTNYVIAGNNLYGTIPVLTNSNGVPANTAKFKHLYGIKRWYDIDGYPSFFAVDSSNNRLVLVYYDSSFGPSGINNSACWLVRNFTNNGSDIALFYGIGWNINVEDGVNPGEKTLIVMESGKIRFFKFTLTPTPTSVQSCNLSNYTIETVINNTNTSVDGLNGGTGRVYEPNAIWKYYNTLTSETLYLFNQELVIGLNLFSQSARKFKYISPGVYDFNTLNAVSGTPLPNGGSGAFTSLFNAAGFGFFNDLQNNLYDITLGGFRQWDLDTQECTIYAGGSNALDTTTEYDNYPDPLRVDSQYQLGIDCTPNACDAPTFNVSNITDTSAIVTITNYNIGNAYDLSIDGGITYLFVGITNPFIITGLDADTQYLIVVKAHCGLTGIGISNTTVINTSNPTNDCIVPAFAITNIGMYSISLLVTNHVIGNTYSVSTDGGATFVQTNIPFPSILISGLLPNTSYNIVVKRLDNEGNICSSSLYVVTTQLGFRYCIEVLKTYNGGNSHTVTATLKNNLGQAVNAIGNLTVSLKIYDSSGNEIYPSFVMTILGGTSTISANFTASDQNAFVCYDPVVWAGCLNTIASPCLCNLAPCPCQTCIEITQDPDTGQFTFHLNDCNGDAVLANADIDINVLCNGTPYTVTILTNTSSVGPVGLAGCSLFNIQIVSVTPGNYKRCLP